MTSPFILTRLEDHILTIEFNRVEKKNAITSDMYATMRETLEDAAHNDDVHVVLLRGKDGIFTAGNDLDDFNNRPKDGPSQGHQFLRVIQKFEKPVIAEVAGLAIGIGVTVLLHCDLVYVAENTRLRMPFVNLGICPEAGSTYLLPQRAGHLAAAELFLLGDFFSPQEAREHGICNRVCSEADLTDFVWEQAQKLANQNPRAVQETKKLMKLGSTEAAADQIETESVIFNQLLQSDASRQARANTIK
ncbi:MAG: enoyl-CoA hydratase [Methylocystaceae bacterium]|nr:enoyl-CoA hydratase [Methylocystaceae bacterium]